MTAHRLHALILADGSAATAAELDAAWPSWRDGISLVVAADGGARLAELLGVRLDRWVGDGDSFGLDGVRALEDAGVPVTLARRDKEESDTELAVLDAVRLGASDLTIVGGLGGERFDHALANVALLAHPALHGRRASLVSARTRVTLAIAPGVLEIGGRVGDLVSLVPLGARVDGIVTEGLRFPLHDESLELGPTRGLSNERVATVARVAVRSGRLLVIETAGTLAP